MNIFVLSLTHRPNQALVSCVPVAQIDATLDRAVAAQKLWRQVPVKERVEYCRRFVAAFVAKKSEIARELTMQMGRYNLSPFA